MVLLLKKILASIAFVVALLSPHHVADACTCAAVIYEVCDYVRLDIADLVVRATVVDKSTQVDINDDITYTINVFDLFKVEPDYSYASILTFITGGNSAACGVNLDIGDEYLLGLNRIESAFDPAQNGQLTVGLCGLVSEWDDVSDEVKDDLDNGCVH